MNIGPEHRLVPAMETARELTEASFLISRPTDKEFAADHRSANYAISE
jgi:hypothetical protein